jgi:hypothetical protein
VEQATIDGVTFLVFADVMFRARDVVQVVMPLPGSNGSPRVLLEGQGYYWPVTLMSPWAPKDLVSKDEKPALAVA